MPQGQVWFGRVISAIHPEGVSLLLGFNQTLSQLIFHGLLQGFIAIIGALHEVFHLLIDTHFRFVHKHLLFLSPAGYLHPVLP